MGGGRGGGRGRREGDASGGEDPDSKDGRRRERRDRERPPREAEKEEEVSKEEDPLAKYKRYENWVPGSQGVPGVDKKFQVKPADKPRRGKKKGGDVNSPDTNAT